MKIGELSKKSGCSIQTIRYYEREGLLLNPNRSEGNFRLYDSKALKQLEFVKHCRSLDISLNDIKRLIELKNKPEESCSSVNALIDRERLANYTYVLKFQGNKLSISGSGWHSSSRQAQM